MKKILIIAPSWIGDMVMATALLQLLHDRHRANGVSDVQIDILAPAYLESLLMRVPRINRIWPTSLVHGKLKLKERWVLAQKMREQGYDQVMVLPNSLKSALIPWLAKIPQRTGWRGEMRYLLLNDLRILDRQRFPLMVQRFVALGLSQGEPMPNPLPLPQLNTSDNFIVQTFSELKSDFNLVKLDFSRSKSNKPILALCIGAEYGESKCWPARYFAEIARSKFSAGWDIWLFGGIKEQKVAAAVQQASGNICFDLVGKTTLSQAVDLLSLARAVVTNDSGLMHIAAALNLPLVAIYGSSSPRFTPPLMKRLEMARIVSLDLACQPCFKRQCPLGHFKCMLDLSPDLVLQELEKLEQLLKRR